MGVLAEVGQPVPALAPRPVAALHVAPAAALAEEFLILYLGKPHSKVGVSGEGKMIR